MRHSEKVYDTNSGAGPVWLQRGKLSGNISGGTALLVRHEFSEARKWSYILGG